MDGFLCIDKPEGPGSFEVVKKLRSSLRIKKIGHSGTLDPLASGLLLCALGKATRLLEFVPHDPKVYQFAIQFGSTTETLDREGAVVKSGGRLPTLSDIRSVLPSFTGEISQTPPRYSAVKLNGTPAYELARKNKEFELKSRTVSIHSLCLDDYDDQKGVAKLTVGCSAGTYVRCLAADIADACDTYGYASFIRRTEIGPHTVHTSLAFDGIDSHARDYILTVKDFFSDYPSCVASMEQILLLRNGRDISMSMPPTQKPVFVYDDRGEIIAVTERTGPDRFHPVKVFGVQ